MKTRTIALLVSSMFLLLACTCMPGFKRVEQTDMTQKLEISEPLPAAAEQPARLSISMGAGKLDITPDSPQWVSGTIAYNHRTWEPLVVRNGSELEIKQKFTQRIQLSGDVSNHWALALGEQPMDLAIEAGAADASINLSGLPLSSLDIQTGAASTRVSFNQPNPEAMDIFSYRCGASSTTMEGLANANFERFDFEGGFGDFSFDFSGTLEQDAAMSLRAGASKITIIVPAGMPVEVRLANAVSAVDLEGSWTVKDGTYTAEGSGAKLTITAEIGLGQLNLIRR